MTGKKILSKSLKILAWILGSVIFLLLLILILIQIPAVQNFAKEKLVAYLQDKIHTKVSVKKLSIDFPKQIVLENVYLEDQTKDTLISGGKIQIDIALFKLLSNKVQVDYLGLENTYLNIKRLKPEYTFNYDYIIKAFASTDTTANSSESSSMTFQLGEIVLKNIRLNYHDDVTGNDGVFRLGKLETNIKTFDPSKSVYAVPKIDIENINSSLRQYKPLIEPKPEAEVEAKSNEPINIDLQLHTINFKGIKFDYNNEVSALKTQLDLGEFSVDVKKIDLSKLYVNLDKIELNNTSVAVELGKSQQAVVAKEEVKKQVKSQANNPWKIEVGEISLDSNQLKYDDNNYPKVAKGLDYNHIAIKDFSLNTQNLILTPNEYKGELAKLSFKEQSGLQLNEFHTNFVYNDKEAILKDLVLKTNNSTINTNFHAKYPSIDSTAKDLSLLYVDAAVSNTSVAVKDLLLINPALTEQLKGNENSVIQINALAKGSIDNLSIPSFGISGIGSTNIQVAGNIKGLPDAKNAYYDVKLNKFNTTKKDLLALIPKNTLPDNIEIPDVMTTTGYFKGTMDNFNSHINAKTNKGNADVTAKLAGKGKSYNVNADLNNVDLGYILKQDSLLGKISMKASAKGSGFDYKTMNTIVDANVESADVKGYTYKNLQLNVKLNDGDAQVTSSMKDPNVTYNLQATANVKSTYPTGVNMQLALDTLNLYALHFMDSLFTIHTIVNADMPSANPDSLVGTLSIANTKIVSSSQTLATDSVKLDASREGNIQSINLNSEVAKVDWKGEFKLTETGDQVMQTIKRYYDLPYKIKDTTFSPQEWSMNILINPSAPLALQFAPGLKGSDTLGAYIAFNSKSNDLDVKMHGPHIQYGEQTIENFDVSAGTDDQELNYALNVDKAGSKSFFINKTSVDGKLANNELFANILFKDRNDKDQYHLSTKVDQPATGTYKLSLIADSLLLNYEKWQVSNDNYIQYDSSGIVANNFGLTHNNQSLSINSATKTTSSPLDITFKDFRVKTITNFAQQDSLFMDGIINGEATIKDVMSSPVFTSNLTIKDLSYKQDTVGTVFIKVDNQTANAFNTDVKIEGNGNDVQLAGKYYTGEGRMDMKLDINNIDLSTVKNFAAGQLLDAGGNLKGNVAIAGTTSKPQVDGSIHFSNAFVTPTISGEPIKLTNEEIKVDNQGIAFNNFTMVDSAGNKAVLDGRVITSDFLNYVFDLSFNADDFTALNSTKANNQLFYGKLNIDADVKVKGSIDAPSVKATFRANKNTDFIFVLPSEDPEVVSREGVVNFIDVDGPKDSIQNKPTLDTVVEYKSLAGTDIDVTFETDTAAAFTLVVDERNGDALKIKGDAELSGGLDPSGKLTMSGNYAVQSGSYEVTLSVLKRKFLIQKGSVITWKGSPTSADVDITAMYQLNTSTIDLMQSQSAGTSGGDLNKYKQKIPIQVLLKMTGELMKPVISFDIVLPSTEQSQWSAVDDKLAQVRSNESELNKQVFALLLLGRFTQEDPFVSAGGSSNEALVRQSVSRLLTDQLNKLANSLVKGVELNVGVNSDEDYSTGSAQNRTDLTVGVSKSLLNDRLRVSVGSDFLVEGSPAENEQASNIAGDVSLDYQLTKDGRYRLRAYRVNKYEGVVEGQVVETGLTFAFTLEYDQFREIFNKSKKKKKNKK